MYKNRRPVSLHNKHRDFCSKTRTIKRTNRIGNVKERRKYEIQLLRYAIVPSARTFFQVKY